MFNGGHSRGACAFTLRIIKMVDESFNSSRVSSQVQNGSRSEAVWLFQERPLSLCSLAVVCRRLHDKDVGCFYEEIAAWGIRAGGVLTKQAQLGGINLVAFIGQGKSVPTSEYKGSCFQKRKP